MSSHDDELVQAMSALYGIFTHDGVWRSVATFDVERSTHDFERSGRSKIRVEISHNTKRGYHVKAFYIDKPELTVDGENQSDIGMAISAVRWSALDE